MMRRTLVLAMLLSLLATPQAAIDKDDGKFPPGRHNLSSAPDQHNVINLSLHGDLTAATLPPHVDPKLSYDLSQTRRLRDALNVFDLAVLAAQWGQVESSGGVSANCSRDMRSYLGGLSDAKMWAVKMDDASGHYTSGFFYGNNYWMGSLALCDAIDDGQIVAPGKDNSSSVASSPESETKNSGLPFAAAHTQGYSSVYNAPPPFVPGFYVIKMQLNETLPTQVLRTIYVGMCLPSSCSIADIGQMSSRAHVELPSRDLRVLDIRVPTDKEFNIWADKTFCLLIVVSSIVLGLICCGTLFEIYLRRKLKEALRRQDKEMMNNSETSSGIGCASSDYSDTMTAHDDPLKQSDHSQSSNSLKQLDALVLNLPPNDNDSGNGHHHDHDAEHDHHDHHRSGSNNSNSDEHLEGHLHEPEKLSIYSELLLSFSAITNFNAICDRNVGADTIPCIHGLRAFSMAWVILGHTCIVVFKYSDNMEMRKEVEQNFFFQAITNGPFSVDTFFFISGFLISYIYFRTNAKGKLNKLSKGANEFTAGTAHFFGLVAYRFMRLTAPYLFVLGVVQVTMKYLATYSIFDPPTMDHITCPDYWWRNILYINTLFPVDEMLKPIYSKLVLDFLHLNSMRRCITHALSLAWITIACSTGYGGYINSLLSAPCLYPFSRVTYCAYLVHPIVIRSMALNSDAPLHLGGDLMVVMFFGLTVASYFLSFVVSMSFEAPVVTMLKILSPSRKKRLA
ncbi:uncharacterized protein LOC117148124 isoform X2 [Drosophila mauritiana]|uniref:Uncharacterized protein LOC117148124 isoform X2 n=1 Tax=Drosophila mauritiana TaxID=7226 RepID=A0A6P8KQA8_DROMA|nr:uncharacterized protein LOC117148124 isoform X2 [Drosophila mauritiana]